MKRDELDVILDNALASYTLADPRSGFSARIMARVQSDGTAPRFGWLRFAPAALVLAGLAAAIVMWRSETPAPVLMQTSAPRVSKVPVVRKAEAEKPRKFRRSPRRDRLTPEERALLAFTRQAPEAARQLAQPDKPLEIEAINIPPLQIDALEIGEIK